jgi:hypothetical protein
MPSREWYRELLENVRQAHTAHAKAWNAARAKFGTAGKAYEATENELEVLHKHLNAFYEKIVVPLEKPFLAGEPAAINEVLTLLEVGVAAFRSGYTKEWYYRKLKSVPLSEKQINRLREIAINRCISAEHRREDGELRRLMIKLADAKFLRRVAELPFSADPHVQRKRMLMTEVVLRGRVDLQKELSVVPKSRY